MSVQTIQRTSNEVSDLNRNVGKVFHKVVQGASELAASHTKQWETASDAALQLQNSLELTRNHEINALERVFGGIHNQLVSYPHKYWCESYLDWSASANVEWACSFNAF